MADHFAIRGSFALKIIEGASAAMLGHEGLGDTASHIRTEMGLLFVSLADPKLGELGAQMLRAEAEAHNAWALVWAAEEVRKAGAQNPCELSASTQTLIAAMNASDYLAGQPYVRRLLRTRGEEARQMTGSSPSDSQGCADNQHLMTADAVWAACEELGVLFDAPQRPRSFSPLPGRSKRFWDAKSCSAEAKLDGAAAFIDTVRSLESATSTIQEEVQRVMDSSAVVATEYEADTEQLTLTGEWSQLHLMRSGQEQPGCGMLQYTCNLTRSLQAQRLHRLHPLPSGLSEEQAHAIVFGAIGDVKLSRMQGGTRVRPHCGPSNQRLRLQLALSVPDRAEAGGDSDGYIEVGGEKRGWEQGRVLAFDDSFEHHVELPEFSTKDADRLVLILDIPHPGVSDQSLRSTAHSCIGLFTGTLWSECADGAVLYQFPFIFSNADQHLSTFVDFFKLILVDLAAGLCTTVACLQEAAQCSESCTELYAAVAEGCESTLYYDRAGLARRKRWECRAQQRWC